MSNLANQTIELTNDEIVALTSLGLLSETPTGYHLAKNNFGFIVNTLDTGNVGSTAWQDYVMGSNVSPTFLENISGGSVYLYTFNSSPIDKTIYRFVPDPYTFTQDKFYSSYTSPNLSGLLAARSITI